ncbi:hypothetical protein Bca4012_093375 [Brassica carinata]
MDILMDGFENTDLALHYGAMFRECIRHQIVAKLPVKVIHLFKDIYENGFDPKSFPWIQICFGVGACEQELLTRHKSTVAEFLTKNEDWFFADYNSISTAEAERYMGNTRKRENKGTCST